MPDPQPTAIPHAPETHPEVRHERTDANARAIVFFGLSLVGLLIVLHFLVHWMFDFLERKENREDPRLPAVAKERPRFPAQLADIPSPVLQRDERYDLEGLRQVEDRQLNEVGWSDRRAKTVRIPIAEALSRLETDPRVAAANGIRFRTAPKKGQQTPPSPRDGGKK